MVTKKIAWEKWDDDILTEEIAESLIIEDDEGDELTDDAMELMSKIPKLVSTPMGVFQLYDKMSPIKQYECWMGYTNFDITNQTQSQIEKVEGVELLFVISRYRFFLGVGKMFDFRNVRTDIESILKCNQSDSTEDEISTEETIEIIKEIISEDKHWAIFVGKDGVVDYASTNQDHDISFLEKVRFYKKTVKRKGGTILHPDSEE